MKYTKKAFITIEAVDEPHFQLVKISNTLSIRHDGLPCCDHSMSRFFNDSSYSRGNMGSESTRTTKQITEVSTSLVSVCHVENFTHITHMCFVTLNALKVIKLDT